MAGEWRVRRYGDDDAAQLRSFTCFTPGQRWTKPPQKIIRAAPDSDENPSIFVAVDLTARKGRILGVIVFDADERFINSLGVVRDRRQEGIGIALKRACLAELAAIAGTEVEVLSTVHKRNIPMRRLNECLGVGTTKDPDEGDYLLSGLKVVPAPPPAPATTPAQRLQAFLSRLSFRLPRP
jgi:hypothetical protein